MNGTKFEKLIQVLPDYKNNLMVFIRFWKEIPVIVALHWTQPTEMTSTAHVADMGCRFDEGCQFISEISDCGP